MNRLLSLACCGLLFYASGCVLPGEGSKTVTVSPEKRYIDYEQEFQEAYAAPAPDGGYDLVMATGTSTLSTGHGARLYPATSAPVSHVLIIHVAWRPTRAASGDYPAAANSTIDWYAFDGKNEGVFTHYQGVGFVRVDLAEKETLFDLRDVKIVPRSVAPTMRDPIGNSRLAGLIRARNDAPMAKVVTDSVVRRLQTPPTTAPTAEKGE